MRLQRWLARLEGVVGERCKPSLAETLEAAMRSNGDAVRALNAWLDQARREQRNPVHDPEFGAASAAVPIDAFVECAARLGRMDILPPGWRSMATTECQQREIATRPPNPVEAASPESAD